MTRHNLDRRAFIAGTTSLSAAGLLAGRATADESSAPPLRAAVLEHADRWTQKATGLGTLLASVGMTVEALQLDRAPGEQTGNPQLIAFGSFTNNGDEYKEYVERYAAELQQFVADGGVVLEMTQSDQFGNEVDYLPAGMVAKRGDRDLSSVYAIDRSHPLVAGWFPQGTEMVGSDFFGRPDVNWESFESWGNMRVLLASAGDGNSPCLLEGANGEGRFVVSSLCIDKCFRDGDESAYGDVALERGKQFAAAVSEYVRLVVDRRAPRVEPTKMPPAPSTGPMIGHVDHQSARVWFRPSDDHRGVGEWQLKLEAAGTVAATAVAKTDADHDYTMVFDVDVEPNTAYQYTISPVGESNFSVGPHPLKSDRRPGELSQVVLGLGSCAPSDPNYVWQRIIDEGCEGFVFLGDTPYIDTSDLHIAREKHRQFLAQPEISKMIAQMPCWGTWDDHDFGKNDGHGDFPGKHICRAAFTEYRANATFGHNREGKLQTDRFGDGRGIYTSFRRGPLEVFLLDPRWFSRTEASWADAEQPTCLGKIQWEWLKQGLSESKATFKALATGMIWDDKTNSEKDDWYTYRHERDAIFDFIRDEKIAGCFLVSGDIHVSRALNYGPRVGYDLWEFIISPLHDRIIPELDVPHPNLVHHALEPFVFLRLDVDGREPAAQLKASWINRDGKRIFEVALAGADLQPT